MKDLNPAVKRAASKDRQISFLETQVRVLTERVKELEGGLEVSNVMRQQSTHSGMPRFVPLPMDSSVRFNFGELRADPNSQVLDCSMRDGLLEVRGDHSLVLVPHCSNVVFIRTTR